MPELSFHLLPKDVKNDPNQEEYVKRMRPLRLQSLKDDSHAFVSRYEVEVEQPLSFWLERLEDPKAWSIVLVQSTKGVPQTSAELLVEHVQWKGFSVMIDPSVSTEVSTRGTHGRHP
jgi:hypothetical protein